MKNKKNKKFHLLPRLIVGIFMAIAVTQTVATIGAFSSPEMASAQSNTTFTPQVRIQGTENIQFGDSTRPIAEYIKAIYAYAVGAVGILATVMLMIGGLRWILAAGNPSSISEAKDMIIASISGMVLVLTSYLVLNQVNPALTDLSRNITKIKTIEVPQGEITSQKEANLIGCTFVEQIANLESLGCVKSDKEECTGNPDESLKNPECCCKYNPVSNDCFWSVSECSSGFEGVDTGKYSASNIKACGSETDNGNLSYCCCKILKWEDWSFDSGISSQLGQTDPALRTLLGCMRKQLPRNVGRISSISDSDVVYPATMDRCITNYSKPECDHTKNSCHYGCGTNTNWSCAVDFGDEENATAIKEAANYCGAGFVLDEGNHIHVSTASCPNN